MNRIIRTMAIMAGSLGFFPLGVSAQSYSDVWNQKGLNARYHGNYSLAYQCFKMSAEYGDEKGQYNLGYCYLTGLGVLQDEARAFQWFEKAADKGNAAAQNALGLLYQRGEGVEHDDAEAVGWFRKASDQGYPEAFANLGYMYAQGFGVPQDERKAVELYLQGADKGNVLSMIDLGLCYWKGYGVDVDMVQALHWLDVADLYAQRSGDKLLKWRIEGTREEMRHEMTLEQIHRAGQLAQEWEEKHKKR